MKILCCVKHVPDTNSQIQVSADKKDIVRNAISFVMSPYDEFSVEEALRIKEKIPGSSVTVITLGPERADQVLRTALAMGADSAVHLFDEKGTVTDPLVVARCLKKVISEMEYDLIFTGRQAVDDDSFQVGTALACMLDIASITLAGKVSVNESARKVSVERVVEGGTQQTICAGLPALVTTQKGLNEPRFASLPGIMKAKSKPVTKKNVSELGVNLSSDIEVDSLEIPQYVRRKHIIATEGDKKAAVDELLNLLRTEAKVIE